jgi:hypothetical protein
MKLLAILGILVIVIGAFLYFAYPKAQSSSSSVQDNSNSNTFPRLTVQAWNDASYSIGSRKWEFLYEPSYDSPFLSNSNLHDFSFFPVNPSDAERHSGKPTLIIACVSATTLGATEVDGTLLSVTAGASESLDGMGITVAIANPFNVTLVLKPPS